MKRNYEVAAEAWEDVREIGAELEEAAGEELADRFLVSLDETFSFVGRFPKLGSKHFSRRKALRNIKCRPVIGFRKYLVFYRERKSGVLILHVFHGSRNLSELL